MKLEWTDPNKTTITLTLEEGEEFTGLIGPTVAYVPTDPANTHYAAIVDQNLLEGMPTIDSGQSGGIGGGVGASGEGKLK